MGEDEMLGLLRDVNRIASAGLFAGLIGIFIVGGPLYVFILWFSSHIEFFNVLGIWGIFLGIVVFLVPLVTGLILIINYVLLFINSLILYIRTRKRIKLVGGLGHV